MDLPLREVEFRNGEIEKAFGYLDVDYDFQKQSYIGYNYFLSLYAAFDVGENSQVKISLISDNKNNSYYRLNYNIDAYERNGDGSLTLEESFETLYGDIPIQDTFLYLGVGYTRLIK